MNKILKSIFNFYINSSIHVAVAVVCLCGVSLLKFGYKLHFPMLLFVFCGTITGYNFVKYARIARLHHLSLAKNLKAIQIFSLLIFLAFIISTFYQNWEILFIAAISGIFTMFYALPVFSENRNLRGLPGLKVYVIGLVVSMVTVLLPLVLYETLFQRDVMVEFFQRFMLVIALILPFEIRDLEYDRVHLGTIPQKIGVTRSKKLGYLLIVFIVLSEFLKGDFNLVNLLSLLGMGIITVLFLKGSSTGQGPFYASFWVEAIPIMWLLLLCGLIGIM